MSKSQKNKRKKHRFSHLKRRYKDIVKRQIIRDVVLLSKSDINHDSLFVPSLTKTDTLFEKREQSNQTEDHSLNDDILIQNVWGDTRDRYSVTHFLTKRLCESLAKCHDGSLQHQTRELLGLSILFQYLSNCKRQNYRDIFDSDNGFIFSFESTGYLII